MSDLQSPGVTLRFEILLLELLWWNVRMGCGHVCMTGVCMTDSLTRSETSAWPGVQRVQRTLNRRRPMGILLFAQEPHFCGSNCRDDRLSDIHRGSWRKVYVHHWLNSLPLGLVRSFWCIYDTIGSSDATHSCERESGFVC